MAAKEKKGKIHNRKSVKMSHGIGFIAFYQGVSVRKLLLQKISVP